jgi:predicted nucleotidyltransferase
MKVHYGEDLAGRLTEALSALPEVELAYLFGSWVSGRVRAESDFDVAILVTGSAAADARSELARLLARLGRVVPSERLDVVLLNGAPSLLRHRIVSRGRLLFAREPRLRVRFVARAIQDYQDMQIRRTLSYRERVDRIRRDKGDGRSRDLLAQARRAAGLLEEAAGLPRGN